MQVFAFQGKASAWGMALPELNCFSRKNIVSPKLRRIMNLTGIILLAACLQVSAKGLTQTVSLSAKDAPFIEIIKSIERQTHYAFFYKVSWLNEAKKVTIKAANMPLREALDICFKDQPFTYVISGRNITIKPKEEEKTAFQPSVDIRGKITDKDGIPLAGANVKIKGTDKGTTTNADGSFSLKDIDENSVLEISYVGFETQVISLKGKNSIVIYLNPKNSILDETVVIAYGTTTNRFSTGNVSKVKANEIERQPVTNPLLALQGRVPGLFITQTSGLPGSGVLVRIQGQNSLLNGNGPLYVVDGVPISTEIPSPAVGQSYTPLPNSGESYVKQGITGRSNTLNYLNPADIESIEILKDADATAIYGSRAANGAILITTKKGKAGRTTVSADVQQGFGKVTRTMDVLNTSQYLEMRNEALKNDGLTPTISNTFDPGYAVDLLYWDTTRNTNWQNELIGGTAHYTNVNASISGGTPSIQYLISGTYHKETMVFPDNSFNKRGSMHLNLNNNDVTQKFHFQFSANYSVDNNQLPLTNLTELALYLAPNAPAIYNPDGTLNWAPDSSGNSTWENPLAKSKYKTYQSKTNNLIANSNLSYDILPQLRISSSFGYTNLQSNDIQLNTLLAEKPEEQSFSWIQRKTFFGDSKLNTWIIEPQAAYKQTFGNSKFDAILGSTFQHTFKESGYLAAVGFSSDQVMAIPTAAPTVLPTGYVKSLYKYSAIYGRINYRFNEKYIINLTGRRDGSSRFGVNNRFQNFWSIGGGWIFSQEKFLQSHSSIFSFGKLKANYGTVGSDQIGDYRYLTLYDIVNPRIPYQGSTGLMPGDMPNPYLQWEETKKISVGVELGFFNNRIYLNANYGRNKTSNQLLEYILPRMTGRTTVLENFPATIQNTSWEFAVTTENIKNKKFSWATNINLTIPRNKLVDFPSIETSTYSKNYIVGQPIDIQKLYPYAGVDPATGLYSFLDSTGKATSTPNSETDKTQILTTFPKFYGGFQNTFSFKAIELSFLFQFVKQIASSPRFGFPYTPGRFWSYNGTGNQPVSVLKRWQKPGDNANVQKFTASDYGIDDSFYNALSTNDSYEDASYIRLKNVSLSWELPTSWKQKAKIQNCRLYVQAQNLLTITNYKGLDPEVPTYSTLPPLRVIMMGLQLRF